MRPWVAAESSAAVSGDEDALGVEKIVAEHGYLLPSGNLVIS